MPNSSILTRNATTKIVNNDTNIQPLLQIIDIKEITQKNEPNTNKTNQPKTRIRCVLSDGQYFIEALLTEQCASHIIAELKRNCIIHLKEFNTQIILNQNNQTPVCIIKNCDIIKQCSQKIGQPITYRKSTTSIKKRTYPKSNQTIYNKALHTPPNKIRKKNILHYSRYQPISSLNPYQDHWKIKIRCTSKDDIKHWNNEKGRGKLFNFCVIDKDGEQITVTVFNNEVDKFFPIIEKNKFYEISDATVKMANRQYDKTSHQYTIVTTLNTKIIPLQGYDPDEIPPPAFNFIKINQIKTIKPKNYVDIIGTVVDIQPISYIISNKDGQKILKRTITVADETAAIQMTLWKKDAENYNDKNLKNNIVAFRRCKVSSWMGRSIASIDEIQINPNRCIKEKLHLNNWLQSHKGNAENLQTNQLTENAPVELHNTPRLTFAEIEQLNLGSPAINNSNKKKDYFTVIATITAIATSPDRKPWYKANPDLNCKEGKNAKVVETEEGLYYCEKNKTRYKTYIPRYILRFRASDFTGSLWLTAFDEVGQKILNMNAKDAEELSEKSPTNYNQLFKSAQFKTYVLRCRASSYLWENTYKTRYDAVAIEEINPKTESKKMIEKIEFTMRLQNQQ